MTAPDSPADGDRVTAQPLITVTDVPAAAAFYARLLGAEAHVFAPAFAQVRTDGTPVLQLHADDAADGHALLAEPGRVRGHGVLLWFTVTDFDAARTRAEAEHGAVLGGPVHTNPNTGGRELWLTCPEGYRVVLAEPAG